jgi:GTP cyclohydrolase II/3,4-dihydroxy 2-butanone 4-phosphate synthase/GTP cyclohydrolase II
VDLITNNPLKIAGLVDGGIPVRRRIPLPIQHNPHNREYLKAKQEHSGHLIEMFPDDPNAKAG